MKPKEKLAAREIAGELYIVDIEKETLHCLNPVGAFIWNGLKKGLAQQEIAALVCEEYEVERAEAEADTEAFIAELAELGLVR
jgi:hypothetical protein